MNAKTLFLILLLFTLLNVVPWLIFLSGRRVALGPLVQKQSLNGRSNALRVDAEERGSNEKHTQDETTDESARTRVIIPHVVLDRQSSLRTVRQIAEVGSHAFYTIIDPHLPPSSPISPDATTVGGYEIRRSASRACAILPTNVTIDWEEDYLIGTEKEIISWNALQRYSAMQETTEKRSPAPEMRERNGDNDSVPTLSSVKPPIAHVAEFAYVLMVSNHKYVDGALVCADSIRSHSKLVQSGEADVVLIVTGKIKSQLWELLASVFDRVLIVRSMDVHAPMSYYKTTFDKMYLYSLTEYSSVVFFDADSLLVSNPDSLFRQVSDQHSLTAVGGGDYFQTGLLIIKPSMHLFLDLYLEYRYGPFHYNQWRARDGILFRLCLMESHDNIPHPPSVYHFYGFIKPWFNKDVPHPSSKDPLLLDGRYQEWWERYEALHEKYFAAITQRDLRYDDTVKSYGYGGTSLSSKASKKKQFIPFPFRTIDEARALVNPRQYMWLQRFSGGSEY